MLARALAAEGKKVLAIDADPNGNLAQAVGYNDGEQGRIIPLIERKDIIKERTGAEPGGFGGAFVMNPKVDDLIDRFSVGVNGIRLMVTGELKEALSGCYCPENALLRSFMSHLFMERDEWVVLDMEAGFEHLTRGTAESVDILLVVIEPGQRSVQTAMKITDLAAQLGIRQVAYVLNKIYEDTDERALGDMLDKDKIIAVMPFDSTAVKADLAGKAPFDQCHALLGSINDLRNGLDTLT